MQCGSNKQMTCAFGWLNLGSATKSLTLNGSARTWNITEKLSLFCWKVSQEFRLKSLRIWVNCFSINWFQVGDVLSLFPSTVRRQAFATSMRLLKGFATRLLECSKTADNSDLCLGLGMASDPSDASQSEPRLLRSTRHVVPSSVPTPRRATGLALAHPCAGSTARSASKVAHKVFAETCELVSACPDEVDIAATRTVAYLEPAFM